ncbi:hypothetical protein HMPREF1326_02002 [Akkermansia sp. KLE1605]|nr:hypothetical protein HMPREF1326_02002 [Akkermansia sp. KLE1605]
MPPFPAVRHMEPAILKVSRLSAERRKSKARLSLGKSRAKWITG